MFAPAACWERNAQCHTDSSAIDFWITLHQPRISGRIYLELIGERVLRNQYEDRTGDILFEYENSGTYGISSSDSAAWNAENAENAVCRPQSTLAPKIIR
ncbi:uncharacterized protein N7479_005980 [Penicillium vulpinum]|uniref:uncharacterized protein n=1 Tax=Penicillium vulpinum TaxID=29845 RepID=UPI00254729FA|nr:uncharacterized protein N7479_005980 [Penicillium vulpinum]KAJ5958830.1 hypothetical protein N7479_005980 [Penicillium vulpinum]